MEVYTPELHARLKELVENASPAPWRYVVWSLDPRTGEHPTAIVDEDDDTVLEEPDLSQANLSLVTEGVSALGAVLGEIDRLLGELRSAQHEAWQDGYADCLCDIESVYEIDRESIVNKTVSPYS